MHVQRYSRRTIDTYLYWIKFFIVFNGKQHPSELSDEHIKRFLTFLATERQVSAGTQATGAHYLVVAPVYGSGLRRIEPVRLRVKSGLGWHYLFPVSLLSIDPASGCLGRHHSDENNLNKLVKKSLITQKSEIWATLWGRGQRFPAASATGRRRRRLQGCTRAGAGNLCPRPPPSCSR